MMNPQYLPPGQNNNTPSNPMGYSSASQDYNGIHNTSNSPMPQNGSQSDMNHKMQNLNLNGPHGLQNFSTSHIPPSQFPPNMTSSSNYNQMVPGAKPFQGRPPVSGTQIPPTINQNYLPPSSIPISFEQNQSFPNTPTSIQDSQKLQGIQASLGPTGGGLNGPPIMGGVQQMPSNPPGLANPQIGASNFQQQQVSSKPEVLGLQSGRTPQTGGPPMPGIQPQQRPPQQGPPQQGPPQQGPPLQGPPQQGPLQQGPPLHGPPQQGPLQQGPLQQGPPLQGPPQQGPPQQGPPQQGLPQQGPPQQGPPQQGPHQQGLPQQSPPQQSPLQKGTPQQMPLGFSQASAMPNHTEMLRSGCLPQSGLPSQTAISQSSLPFGQSGITSGQPVLPPQSRQTSQPGQPALPIPPGTHSLSGIPPNSAPSQALPPQQGPHSQSGLLPQTGLPPQHGLQQQPSLHHHNGPLPQLGLPSQPGHFPQSGIISQSGLTHSQPPQYNQYQSMPGLPHMPPPLSQQRQFQGPPGIQGYSAPGNQPNAPYSGVQPMPPQPQMAGAQYPPQYHAQQQQAYAQQYQHAQKRLDPDQMPSPIQVMEDDQQNRGGVFVTNDKGLVPPLVTTDFFVDDKGNSSPRYIRSSMYSVPVTADLLKQTSVPFCLVISPMAETEGTEQEPPLLDFAALTGSAGMGPVRCCRCKAYMCPNMKFIDAGRHFKCAFCKATTEVPMEYTQYINSMQQYGRVPAEMALGTYEIVATKEYCRNNTLPNAPAVVFVIDVSYNAVRSGLVRTVCDHALDVIQSMPKDEQTGKSWTRVGFITYSSTVHFYNIKGTLAQPQMLSVGDVGDVFVPLLEGFLVLPEESGPVLEALLQQLPLMFCDNKETETILLPAVQAGLEALKAADTSGQLFVFHTTLPSYNAPGKLINREDRKLLGTDKEKQILSPQTTAYNELGQACSAAGVSVELFTCNNAYVDAATLGQLPRLTGGQIHKYTYFTAETDGARLVRDVRRAASRPTAHDAVMRVRTSTGVRATDFYGHFFMSNTTDVELAAVDADKAVGVEVKYDDKLTAEDGVYVQAALLYTHRCGQRRLRVINLALAVAHQLADVYRTADLDTCLNFLTKQAVWALRELTPRAVREGLTGRCARSLAAYRRHCASPSSSGQLVLPESMKLLPLYTNCLLRSDALAGGPDVTCDERACAMFRALTADVSRSVVYTYPRLLPLHVLPAAAPAPLRASADKLADHGVYLLENGVHMLIWVGSQASPEFVRDVFGAAGAQAVDTQVCELPDLDNATSKAVRAVVEDARRLRRTAMRLTVMRQHDKLETVLRHFLVEDRGVDGSSSYVDYLCHIHKEIRTML